MNKIIKLKELVTIQNGKDYKHLGKGNVPLYGSGGLMGYVDDYLYKGESVLLPRKGTLNNIMYVNEAFWNVDTMYWTIINKQLVYPKYLYCYLFLLDLSHKDSGSTLPSMTFNSYYDLPIKLIDYDMQKRIGDLYFTITHKIELNSKINKELESLVKTIYDYWFLQFEFPNEKGKPYKSSGGKMVWNDELKREIPEGWEVYNISEISDIYQPKTISDKEMVINGKYNVYGANGIVGKYNKYNHSDNEIALCCRGASCGNYLMTMPFSWITGNSMVISPFDKRLKEYLYNSLSVEYISKFITGSAQPQITRTNISNIKVIIPSSKILNKFNCLSMPNRKIIQLITEDNEKLSQVRDFLLPLLMNGQVGFKE